MRPVSKYVERIRADAERRRCWTVSDHDHGPTSFEDTPRGEASARILAMATGATLTPPTLADDPWSQMYTVTMESGAVYLVRLDASSITAGCVLAVMLATEADGGREYASPCPYPVSAATLAHVSPGAHRFLSPADYLKES